MLAAELKQKRTSAPMDRTKVQCIHTLTRYLCGTWQSNYIKVLPQARGRLTEILTDNLTILGTCLEQLESSSSADQQSSGAPKVSRTGCDVAYSATTAEPHRAHHIAFGRQYCRLDPWPSCRPLRRNRLKKHEFWWYTAVRRWRRIRAAPRPRQPRRKRRRCRSSAPPLRPGLRPAAQAWHPPPTRGTRTLLEGADRRWTSSEHVVRDIETGCTVNLQGLLLEL